MTTNEDEINLERAKFLLSLDNLLEQTLEDEYNIIPTIQISQKIGKEISQENDIGVAF